MPQKRINFIAGITFSMIVHTDAAFNYMSEEMLIMMGSRLEHAIVVQLPHEKEAHKKTAMDTEQLKLLSDWDRITIQRSTALTQTQPYL